MIFALLALTALGLIALDLIYGKPPGYVEETIPSEILGEDRPIAVRTPPGYGENSEERYPVLYKLDGYDRLTRYEKSLDLLKGESGSGVLVVAIPNLPGTRLRDLTPPTMPWDGTPGGEPGGGDRFLDFLERELIPHIESRYRTTSYRIVVGYSRGGLLVLHSLLTRPELFQAYVAFAPGVWREDGEIVARAESTFAAGPDLPAFLYTSVGDAESPRTRVAFARLQEVLRMSAPEGLHWEAELAAGGDHRTTPILSLPPAFAALAEHWRQSGPPGTSSASEGAPAR